MKVVIYILFLLNIQNALSQGIKIELSLEWSKSELKISEEYDTILHPYLCVKYINLTQDSLYIPRTIYGCNGLPLILSWEFSSNHIDYKEKGLNTIIQKIVGNCSVGKYDVQLDQFRYTLHVDKYTEEDILESDSFYNMRIEMIHKYIANRNKFEYLAENSLLRKADVEDSKRYIFLNPEESLIDKFDLIAFLILHGEYVFRYDNIPSNTTIMKVDQKCYRFPDTKRGYRFYCGSVIPETLDVIF